MRLFSRFLFILNLFFIKEAECCGEVVKDFYAEVPVDIVVSGSYFSVANFFAAIANLPRIVNITNVAFSDIKNVNNRMMTKVTCLATTFRFLDKKEIKDDKKPAK